VADFSPAALSAFAHALVLALNARGEFILLQVGKPPKEWSEMPGVRDLLVKWGYLEPGTERAEVLRKLAVRVTKMEVASGYKGVTEVLGRRSVDLVVVPAEGHGDLVSMLRPSAAEKIAHSGKAMTLLVPASGRGFVSPQTGEMRLTNILIPVLGDVNPRPALTYAVRAAAFSIEEVIRIHLLYCGSMAGVRPIDRPYLEWHEIRKSGDPAEQILRTAESLGADLIVMPSSGRHGFLDAWRGSVTDQVVRRTQWPVLAVPLEE
jgi:nucleotide-binding universal stress UspA family protein